ncbi:MAG: hypothetical protein EOP84_24395 [Verrucomicrobiaceae bacterium]|nr:MAG: hypothetical protein EOP84_24395 [Verrucomicrobiaceae bacterium]
MIQTDGTTSTSVALQDTNGNGLWSGSFTERGYDVSFDANTGYLNLTAVPETHAAGIGLVGASLLVLRRRKNFSA